MCLVCEEAARQRKEEEDRGPQVMHKQCTGKNHKKWFDWPEEWQPLKNFSKHKKAKDGLKCWCKHCDSEYNRQRHEKIKKRNAEKEDSDEEELKTCNLKRHHLLSGEKVPKEQPRKNFYRNATMLDGRQGHCMTCHNKLEKLRRQRNAERNNKRAKTIPSGTKRCGSSKHVGNRDLPYTEFYRDRTTVDGFASKCKTCDNK